MPKAFSLPVIAAVVVAATGLWFWGWGVVPQADGPDDASGLRALETSEQAPVGVAQVSQPAQTPSLESGSVETAAQSRPGAVGGPNGRRPADVDAAAADTASTDAGSTGSSSGAVKDDPDGAARTDNVASSRTDGAASGGSDEGMSDGSDDAMSDDDVAGAEEPPPTDRIQGQVQYTDGSPASGATVTAHALRLFDEWSTEGRESAEMRANAFGEFDLRGLRLGEYNLSATAPGDDPVVTNLTVRTGSVQVRLVIGQVREIWVDGYVVSRSGDPLSGVSVTAPGFDAAVQSAADGTFGFFLSVPDHRPVGLKLSREGYEPGRARVDPASSDGQGVVPVDVVLTPVQSNLTVSGYVVDAEGQRLAGKSLYLTQGSSKYRATTDANGAFAITGVSNPGLYALAVSPEGVHAGYQEPRFSVPAEGVQGHTIALDWLDIGSLVGVMRDAYGQPVPHFTLSITSASAPRETVSVTSDDQGWFTASNVPAGALRIQSLSFPRFVTSGIALAPGDTVDVEIVLDRGDEQLAGVATDDAGQPLAGVDLTLSWVQRSGAVVHESLRKTTTDGAGAFLFTGLGPDARDLIVRAPNYESVRLQGVAPSRGERLRVALTRSAQ